MSAAAATVRRRAAVVVIDACGVGALPDADLYGDEGANTLAHVAKAVGGLRLPNMERLGLGAIVDLVGVRAVVDPAIHGRLHPLGPGKDSIAGHWELMGVVADHPPPTYPQGLAPELLARLSAAIGHELICNRPYNGIAAIEDYGARHLESGALILYTSQDSVVQLAGHVDRVSCEELYRACAAAREVMQGPDAVGRVIARPFTGAEGRFDRTDGRRDFALAPPRRSYLELLGDAGVPVHGVGKISDLFAGRGVDESHPAAGNADGLRVTTQLLGGLARGLVFTNLIETDQRHGHRKDSAGFHRALRDIDSELGRWLELLGPDDLLVLTADHGVDPRSPGTDHTREYAPLLAVVGQRHDGRRHDGPLADVGASVLRWLAGRETDHLPGRAFVD